MEKRIRVIVENEKLTIDDPAIEALYEASEGDCRKLINLMQATASISTNITKELVNMIVSSEIPPFRCLLSVS